jgi:hypothetical protein
MKTSNRIVTQQTVSKRTWYLGYQQGRFIVHTDGYSSGYLPAELSEAEALEWFASMANEATIADAYAGSEA